MSGRNQGARHFRGGGRATEIGLLQRAKTVELDGYLFRSQGEARRYQELDLLQATGEIWGLQVYPRLPLVVNGKKIKSGWITLDFKYWEKGKHGDLEVVEDYKGRATREFLVRWEVVKALHPHIDFRLVK